MPRGCCDLHHDIERMVEDSHNLNQLQLEILADMMDPVAHGDFVPGVQGWLKFHYDVTRILNKNRQFLGRDGAVFVVTASKKWNEGEFSTWVGDSQRLAIHAEKLKQMTEEYGRDHHVRNMERGGQD